MNGMSEYSIEALISPEDEVFTDYLHFAVHRCSEAADVYSGGARLVLDTPAAAFLNSIAHEKKQMASQLRSFLKQPCYLLDESDEGPVTVSISNYLLDVDLHAASSMDEAFLYAFKREHRSTDMFAKLAGLEQNESVRRLFHYLVERQHEFIRFMEAELVKLRMSITKTPYAEVYTSQERAGSDVSTNSAVAC